jgi:serine phosphatase RsbU (regulator of sigma subunit)
VFLRTKLVIAYSALVAGVVAALLLIADYALEDLTRRNLSGADHALSQVTEANRRLAEQVLTRNGERIVSGVAESAATELSLLLAHRSTRDYGALRADARLRAAANRDIRALGRVAGYTDVYDRTGVSVWHPNPDVEGRNFAEWKDRYPEMWALVVRSFREPEVRGYYSFLDRYNHSKRKYMVLRQVPNTPFIVAAVVNIEDFFAPVQREIGAASQQARAAMAARVAAGADAERDRLESGVGVAAALALAGAVLLALWLARRVAAPLSRLRDGVIRLGRGDFAVEVPEQGGAEVRDLAQAFNRLGGELDRYTARLAGEAAAREALESEVRIARRIQEAMLPGADSPCLARSEYELHGANREAREVGGDFYDFFRLAGDRLAVLIADVSGKGIPAALFMAVSRTLLKDACQRSADPAQALARANRALCQENEACMFVTVFLAFYDIASGRLDYANGGHPEPRLLRAAGGQEILARLGDPVLGALPDHAYRCGHADLRTGDTLFLYTDGVTEAMSPEGEAYGLARLERLLAETATLPAETMGRRVVAALDDYQKGTPFDDITLLILRRKALAWPRRDSPPPWTSPCATSWRN